MREYNYLKRKCNQMLTGEFEDVDLKSVGFRFKKKHLALFSGILTMLFLAISVCFLRNLEQVSVSDVSQIQPMQTSIAATSTKRAVLEIPVGVVKKNPFLPYREIDKINGGDDLLYVDLIEPPEALNTNSEAARVMRTVVSGILYDKYSPSAILNIEGTDYLVKKGDTVNNYKILNIVQDSVTVKLGENTYKAGIGELLTEGTIKHNDVSNLNNKFGGENNGVH